MFRFAHNPKDDWSKTATNNTKKVSSDNLAKSLSSSSFGSSTINWTSKAKATLTPFSKRNRNTAASRARVGVTGSPWTGLQSVAGQFGILLHRKRVQLDSPLIWQLTRHSSPHRYAAAHSGGSKDKCFPNQTSPKCVSSSSSSSDVEPNSSSSSSSSSILPVSQMIDKVRDYCSTRTDNFYKNIIMSDSFANCTRL
ncbi:hypothetical protein CCH79_00018480 [Gambusia affinis]|uniref:Uncharacterized protein n=1 Tax=Gambusia affinis TaxID=33528 RepID=A0A315UQS8_GAMAF|nr:hypothetical protein CCH79_00018480 [Gambusia affinis]